MKLYKPVPIVSAEQAEALPEKAVIITYSPRGEVWEAALREDVDAEAITPDGGWYCQTLVPIEAEEEYSTAESRRRWGEDGIYDDTEQVRLDKWPGRTQGRYVTEWEDA